MNCTTSPYRVCFLIALVLFSSVCYGQTATRKKINLDDDWRFHVGHAADPAQDFNYSTATSYPDDLGNNLNDLVRRYGKDVIVVEYAARKNEVNKIDFELPGGKGKGACIWEPLSTWERIFDTTGKSNDHMVVYDEINKNLF